MHHASAEWSAYRIPSTIVSIFAVLDLTMSANKYTDRKLCDKPEQIAVAEIQFPRWGGGGGVAKLHEFPTTLRRFARFTIAYSCTKTTLGQHIEDAIQHATR